MLILLVVFHNFQKPFFLFSPPIKNFFFLSGVFSFFLNVNYLNKFIFFLAMTSLFGTWA